MEEMDIWDEIVGIGKLYIQKELIVGYEPVLFVCTTGDAKPEHYLIMTYDSCESVYIMQKVDMKDLLDMLENRITMEQCFRKGKYILKTYINANGNMCFEKFLSKDFDEKYLPHKGEYLKLGGDISIIIKNVKLST